MGSSDFAVPVLESLLGSSNYKVESVYTKVPKPAGRGKPLTKTPVHVVSEEYGVDVRTPLSLGTEEALGGMLRINPDVIVVASYGLILPKWVLDMPKKGCVNVHPSLLPRWRGAAPMQHAILSGDEITGVTIMKLVELLDAGDMFLQESTPIGDDNIEVLSRRLSYMGSKMLIEVLDNIDHISAVAQGEVGVTYAKKVADFQIDFCNTAEFICRQVRALYPKAFFFLKGKRVRILRASSYALDAVAVGCVINDDMHIGCGGNTVLVPELVQLESKSPCDVKSFLRGHGSMVSFGALNK